MLQIDCTCIGFQAGESLGHEDAENRQHCTDVTEVGTAQPLQGVGIVEMHDRKKLSADWDTLNLHLLPPPHALLRVSPPPSQINITGVGRLCLGTALGSQLGGIQRSKRSAAEASGVPVPKDQNPVAA